MIKILNVIKQINNGGSSRSITSIAKSLIESGEFEVTVAAFKSGYNIESIISDSGIKLLLEPSREVFHAAISEADIVNVDWWNDPIIYDFLRQDKIPECRMCAFVHVAGDYWPNILTSTLINYVDFIIAGCRYTSTIPILRNLSKDIYEQKVKWVFDATNFDRLANFQRQVSKTFNIGYVGSVDFKKMHPNFIQMSAAANIPDVKFFVLGKGHIDLLEEQAKHLGVSDKFEFPGFVKDIKSYFEKMDVFGYPLCDAPGAELVIQDALYAGIPAVVFPLGGLRDAVHDNFNGFVVDNEKEYTQALEYLYHNPEERKIMGENAHRFATRVYGRDNSAARISKIYKNMMNSPKRNRSWGENKSDNEIHGLSTGSAQLIESLGHQSAPFLKFFQIKNEKYKESILRIYETTPKEKTVVERYYEYYPNDPYLMYWNGVIELSQANHTYADKLFQKALDLGLPAEIIEETSALQLNGK